LNSTNLQQQEGEANKYMCDLRDFLVWGLKIKYKRLKIRPKSVVGALI
jgi:hypothetical protein